MQIAHDERGFEYQVKHRDGAVVFLPFEDHLTAANVEKFRAAVRHLLEEGSTKVVLNLRNVEHMDSTGLGALIGMSETMRYERGQLVLMNLRPAVEDLLATMQMRSLLSVVGDDE